METKLPLTHQNQPFLVHVMGQFSCAGQTELSFAARSAATLIAYLVIHRNRWVTRQELVDQFWPGTEPSIGRANLRKAVQRARASFATPDVVLSDSDKISINRELVLSDLDRTDSLHRHYAFAPHLPESINYLLDEWKVLDRPLLENWDDDWVVDERRNFESRSHELGLRLAEALEANGRYDECFEVMQQILHKAPLDFELLQRALRLQSKSSGGHAMTLMLEQLLADLPPQLEIPKPVRRLIQRIRQGQTEQVPVPELFETKNELAMLARMVEANIRSNGTEAMALLAKESSNVDNWSHAKTLLSILAVALENIEINTDDQIQIAINAAFLASYASDFQIGEWAAKKVLNVLLESDERYIRTLSVLAFLHFETKNYDHSRELHNRAIELCHQYKISGELARVLNRKAVLEYHLGNFDLGRGLFLEAIERESITNDASSDSRLASFHGNLCSMEALRGHWESARHHGEQAFQFAERSAKIYQIYVSAAYGLALCKLGVPGGIELIIDGIVQTTRERMRRFNMMSIDFGVALLADKGEFVTAAQIAALNRILREASGYPRGPAEIGFIRSCFDGHSEKTTPSAQPISLVALSRWIVEELEAFK